MTTQLMQVATLDGDALDWAVADVLEWKEPFHGIGLIQNDDGYLTMFYPDPDENIEHPTIHDFNHCCTWSPRRFWNQGGILMSRYKATYTLEVGYTCTVRRGVSATTGFGDNHLIALCRAIVASHRGATIHIPLEFINESA